MDKTFSLEFMLIDKSFLDRTCEAYFEWKKLNQYISAVGGRGINMADAISEPMACYALGLFWNRSNVGGDATNMSKKRVIEFKATSRFEGDLSSFGPDVFFDDLILLRFKLSDDLLYIYDLNIDSETFVKGRANKNQTIEEQQKQGRRPHISLIDTFVKPQNLEPTLIFDIRNKRIIEDNR